jgi:hypothetical protein
MPKQIITNLRFKAKKLLYKIDNYQFARRGYLLSFSSQQTSKVIINITHDIHKNIIFAVGKNAKFSNRAKQAVLRCRITE